jgi:hypothetical protein
MANGSDLHREDNSLVGYDRLSLIFASTHRNPWKCRHAGPFALVTVIIKYVTDAGEKVPNTTGISTLSRSTTHPKLNISMLRVPALTWENSHSMPLGELRNASSRGKCLLNACENVQHRANNWARLEK